VIRIVLADDHRVVRQGLKVLLETEPDFTVAGEAGDGMEAIAAVEREQPDVLVLDLGMPGLNGLDVLHEVIRRMPRTRVVVLSMHAAAAYVLDALRKGAHGYVVKGASAEHLVEAVRRVASGRRYLCPSLSDPAVEAYLERGGAEEALDPYDTLTTRERQVLRMAAEGLSNAQMGEWLFISPRTVETHRANLMRKLGLRNETALIRYALKRGIIE
jgi:DNA-binding NarL/FixJ family response regulator